MNSIVLAAGADEFQHLSSVIGSIARRSRHFLSFHVYSHLHEDDLIKNDRFSVEIKRVPPFCTWETPVYVDRLRYDVLSCLMDDNVGSGCLLIEAPAIAVRDIAPYFTMSCERAGAVAPLGNRLQEERAAEEIRTILPLPSSARVARAPIRLNLSKPELRRSAEMLRRSLRRFSGDYEFFLSTVLAGDVASAPDWWALDATDDIVCNPVEDTTPSLIRWAGLVRPWTRVHDSFPHKPWRPDLWESEETSWEALRNGWWMKPIAIEVSPPGHEDVTALARRGWKVEVVSEPKADHQEKALPFPDVRWHTPEEACLWKSSWAAEAEMVRFGPGVNASPWLKNIKPLPRHVVLQGPASASDISALKKLGYRGRAEILRDGWAGGGPAPSVLDYEDFNARATDLPEGKYLYLQYMSTAKTSRRDLPEVRDFQALT